MKRRYYFIISYIIIILIAYGISLQVPILYVTADLSSSELEIELQNNQFDNFYDPEQIFQHESFQSARALNSSLELFIVSLPVINDFHPYKYKLDVIFDDFIDSAISVTFFPQFTTEKITATFPESFKQDLGVFQDDGKRMGYKITLSDNNILFFLPVDVNLQRVTIFGAIEFNTDNQALAGLGVELTENQTYSMTLTQTVTYINAQMKEVSVTFDQIQNFNISNVGSSNNQLLIKESESLSELPFIFFHELNGNIQRVFVAIPFFSFFGLLVIAGILWVRQLPPVPIEDINTWDFE